MRKFLVKASVSQSVGLGFRSIVESLRKFLYAVFTAFLLGAQHKEGVVWRKNFEDCFLCPCIFNCCCNLQQSNIFAKDKIMTHVLTLEK